MPTLLSRQSLSLAVAIALAATPIVRAAEADRVIFKNGQEIDGTVVRGNADSITIRRGGQDETIARKLIRRIDDTATTDAYFAASSQPLPPWNAIVNDLRSNEDIHQLSLVSKGMESDGPLARVAYISYQMNDFIDLRIYGDPANPAAIRLGLRSSKAANSAERVKLRSFFAGFLTQRKQIAALYALKMDGGKTTAGNLSIAFGAQRKDAAQPQWWMLAWNSSALSERPGHGNTVQKKLPGQWEAGFQRDRDGNLRYLPSKGSVALND